MSANMPPQMPGQPPAFQQPQNVSTKFPIIAIALCAVACLVIIVGSWIAAPGIDLDNVTLENAGELLEKAEAADSTRLIFLLLGSALNLGAFVCGIIGMVKDRPKTFAIIAFVIVLVLPGIAVWLGNMLYV